MSRYEKYFPKDAPNQPVGDAGFAGVRQQGEPDELAPGELWSALNNRCTFGKAEPRLGVSKVPWTNKAISTGSTLTPFETVYGAETFKDPNDVEWLIIAADGKVYRTRETSGATELPLPSGEFINYPVSFTQTYSGMVMFRGTARPPLYMKSLGAGFQSITQEANVVTGAASENPSDGTAPIPNADNGDWVGNRLFIPHETAAEKDLLGISDYLNATRYAPIRAQARINQGSSDRLVRFFKFSNEIGICFKEDSIYQLLNLSHSLGDMVLDSVTENFGLAGARAVVLIGKEDVDRPDQVWFLAKKLGIMAILQGDFGKLATLSVPMSYPIQKIIERIDWKNSHLARFAYADNKFYAAVPLDDGAATGPELIRSPPAYILSAYSPSVIPGASYVWTKGANDTQVVNGTETISDTGVFTAQTSFVTLNGTNGAAVTAGLKRHFADVNNAILVYDFIRQRWAGIDTGRAITVKEFVKTLFAGRRRLFAISADGFINCLEELLYDEVAYETFGANLVTGNYDASGNKVIVTVPGAQYLFHTVTPPAITVVNGLESFATNRSFPAQTDFITLTGGVPSGSSAAVTLKQVIWAIEPAWIDHEIITRGYRLPSSPARSKALSGTLFLETWFPKYSASAITDGVEEEKLIFTDRQKDRLKYYRPFDKPDWDQTNTNDDHATKQREDYSSLVLDATTPSGSIEAGKVYLVESSDVSTACSINYNGIVYTNQQTFTGVAGVATYAVVSGTPLVYGPGSYVWVKANGMDFDLHQQTPERFRVRARGRYVQLKLRNTQGRCALVSGALDLQTAERRQGVLS